MKKKNSNPVGALKRTGAYMSSSMGIIIFALVLAALSAVMTIIGPDKIGKMATIMSDGLFTGIDLAAIAKIGVFLAVIYCLSALFGFIQHYIMAVVTLKMSYRMRGELSEKINRVPQKYFNTTSQGDIFEPHHKRCVNAPAGTYQQPADHHQRRDTVCRLPYYDVRDRMAHGARRTVHHAPWHGADRRHHVEVAALLHRAAEEPRRAQRLCRGDVFRP